MQHFARALIDISNSAAEVRGGLAPHLLLHSSHVRQHVVYLSNIYFCSLRKLLVAWRAQGNAHISILNRRPIVLIILSLCIGRTLLIHSNKSAPPLRTSVAKLVLFVCVCVGLVRWLAMPFTIQQQTEKWNKFRSFTFLSIWPLINATVQKLKLGHLFWWSLFVQLMLYLQRS